MPTDNDDDHGHDRNDAPDFRRIRARPDPADCGPSDFMRLDEAARLFFPGGRMSARALRMAALIGSLRTIRAGRTTFTTPAAIQEMRRGILPRVLDLLKTDPAALSRHYAASSDADQGPPASGPPRAPTPSRGAADANSASGPGGDATRAPSAPTDGDGHDRR